MLKAVPILLGKHDPSDLRQYNVVLRDKTIFEVVKSYGLECSILDDETMNCFEKFDLSYHRDLSSVIYRCIKKSYQMINTAATAPHL